MRIVLLSAIVAIVAYCPTAANEKPALKSELSAIFKDAIVRLELLQFPWRSPKGPDSRSVNPRLLYPRIHHIPWRTDPTSRVLCSIQISFS